MHTSRTFVRSLPNSPSPPLGAERVGVRWAQPQLRASALPASPSPPQRRRVPSLSPRKRAERANLRNGTGAKNMCIPRRLRGGDEQLFWPDPKTALIGRKPFGGERDLRTVPGAPRFPQPDDT